MAANLYTLAKHYPYTAGILSVGGAALAGTLIGPWAGYKAVACLLLATTSLLALACPIRPLLVSAALGAAVWDFFFIPPRFAFRVGSTEDAALLLLFVVVALVQASLAAKLRQWQRRAQEEAERAGTLHLYHTLLNSLSHELRTPIATIIGASDNLLMDAQRLPEETRRRLQTEISTAALRLDGQVENLLHLSRLESGALQLRYDWCDLSELLHTALRRLPEEGDNHRFLVRVPEGFPLLRLDAGLLEVVLVNILGNAVRHTPAGSTVILQASLNDTGLLLVIEDDGPGIPEHLHTRAFDKFFRVEEGRTGGSGLGLSIARGFVQAHGGAISLDTGPQGGARFTIRIPAARLEAQNIGHE